MNAGPILVVGSINVDLVMEAERFPRPGETLHGRRFSLVTGGKGANQAVAAARMGHRTKLAGRIGRDVLAANVRGDLQRVGLDLSLLETRPEATGTAMITTTRDGQNTIVIAAGANGTWTATEVEALRPAIAEAGMVLAQLEIPMGAVEALAELCEAMRVPLMLDPAPAVPLSPALLRRVAWLTSNETEAAALTGITVEAGDEECLRRIAADFLDRGVGHVVLKLGEQGAFAASRRGAWRISPFQVEAIDSTGAGDALNGALAVALLEGQTEMQAVTTACAAAALSTTVRGTLPAMPGRDSVRRLVAGSGRSVNQV